MLSRYQVYAHLCIVIYTTSIRALETKFRRLLHVGESFFYRPTLAVTTRERGINRNEETILVFLDDDREPTMGITLFH